MSGETKGESEIVAARKGEGKSRRGHSATRRGGASPGNRRGRSSGGELALDEFGDDSMDLNGSWDM